MLPRLENLALASGIASALMASAAAAQVPPPDTNAYVLMDVGPVTVPTACGCISAPFTVPVARPGWGYGSGPAAPETNARPSEADRKRAAAERARERANLRALAEDAQAGNPNASISIAHLLAAGSAAQQREAVLWFELAAHQGHRDAFVQLGYRYHRGLGVKANDRTSAYWYHGAATRGDRIAMVALGLMYAAGRGVPQHWTAAVDWWQKAAADPGQPAALRFLGDAYACGLGVARNFEAAVEAYRNAAKAGELNSSVQLGRIYESGCVPIDDEAAFDAYKAAADQGDPEAQIAISASFLQGRGTPHNAYLAYMWARMAEHRLPDGDLRAQASSRATDAARFLSAGDRADADKFVAGMIKDGATPMR
jgi:TPR repeat protein